MQIAHGQAHLEMFQQLTLDRVYLIRVGMGRTRGWYSRARRLQFSNCTREASKIRRLPRERARVGAVCRTRGPKKGTGDAVGARACRSEVDSRNRAEMRACQRELLRQPCVWPAWIKQWRWDGRPGQPGPWRDRWIRRIPRQTQPHTNRNVGQRDAGQCRWQCSAQNGLQHARFGNGGFAP